MGEGKDKKTADKFARLIFSTQIFLVQKAMRRLHDELIFLLVY